MLLLSLIKLKWFEKQIIANNTFTLFSLIRFNSQSLAALLSRTVQHSVHRLFPDDTVVIQHSVAFLVQLELSQTVGH